MKTHPHKTEGLARPCSAHDLFTVAEGLQCGNCLVLVTDNRPTTMPETFPADLNEKPERFESHDFLRGIVLLLDKCNRALRLPDEAARCACAWEIKSEFDALLDAKQPPKFVPVAPGNVINLKTLCRAAADGNLTAMSCVSVYTGEPIDVLTAMQVDNTGVTLVPLARFFMGDPYVEVVPPGDEDISRILKERAAGN